MNDFIWSFLFWLLIFAVISADKGGVECTLMKLWKGQQYVCIGLIEGEAQDGTN